MELGDGERTKRDLVNCTGGFIGGQTVKPLKAEDLGFQAVAIIRHELAVPPADESSLAISSKTREATLR